MRTAWIRLNLPSQVFHGAFDLLQCGVPPSPVDLSLANGDLIPIEERDEREVTEIDGVRIAPIGIKVGNPAFDVTPHKYVTGIVTENGVAYPPFEVSLRRVANRM